MADRPIYLEQDPFADKLLSSKFDWKDRRIMKRIELFVKWGRLDSIANVKRQSAAVTARYNKNGKKRTYASTGRLLRSIKWMTWSQSGGDEQVFHAHYAYYEKFIELAVGKGDPFTVLPPNIPHKNWMPISVPGKTRKARPSIPTEMRRQARRFTTLVQQRFSFAGTAMMIFAMGNNKENAAAVNRAMFARGLDGRSTVF